MTESVSLERQDLVATITFSSPPYNYASANLIGQIADALDAVDADDGLRCTVLTSPGSVFCAGANLASDELDGAAGMEQILSLYGQAERLFRRRKPMVAAIHGAAVGAGLGLALAADFRVATSKARFSANFVRLGFHPGFALTFTLPRLIGQQKAARMMLTAERVKAETALEWGLIDALVDQDDLAAEARRLAWNVAGNAPLALTAVRASLLSAQGDEVAAAMKHEAGQQAALRATDDYREGVAAVFERRDPIFHGR